MTVARCPPRRRTPCDRWPRPGGRRRVLREGLARPCLPLPLASPRTQSRYAKESHARIQRAHGHRPSGPPATGLRPQTAPAAGRPRHGARGGRDDRSGGLSEHDGGRTGPSGSDVRRQQLGRHRRRHRVQRRLRQARPDQRHPRQGGAAPGDLPRTRSSCSSSSASATVRARGTTSSSTTCTPPPTARPWSSPGPASPTSSPIDLAHREDQLALPRLRFPLRPHGRLPRRHPRRRLGLHLQHRARARHRDRQADSARSRPATSRTRTSSPTAASTCGTCPSAR